MLSAKEANKKTLNSISEDVSIELLRVEDKINNAISVGKYYATIGGTLRAETKRILEQLGYNVKVGTQYNEIYYTVSW